MFFVFGEMSLGFEFSFAEETEFDFLKFILAFGVSKSVNKGT